jgi:hypothetical protein
MRYTVAAGKAPLPVPTPARWLKTWQILKMVVAEWRHQQSMPAIIDRRHVQFPSYSIQHIDRRFDALN